MTWDSTDTPHVSDGVATFRPSDGSDTIVFDDNARSWFRLPDTGAAIWAAIDGQRTVAQLSTSVAAAYDVDVDTIIGDITSMLGDLQDLGLVTAGPSQSQRGRVQL